MMVNCCGIMVLVDESSDQKTHITHCFFRSMWLIVSLQALVMICSVSETAA